MSEENLDFERIEPVKEKVADRPHKITIRLGLLSPAVAVVALAFAVGSFYISCEALKTNQQSMKVGQRAYLAIKTGKTNLSSPTITEPSPLSGPLDLDLPATAALDYSIVVENLGNTPARQIKYTISVFPPTGWIASDFPILRDAKGGLQLKSVSIGDIPQANVGTSTQSLFVYLNKQGWHDYLARDYFDPSGDNRAVIRLRGVLEYVDVFGEPDKIEWCWFAQEGLEWPTVCEQAPLLDNTKP